MKHEWDGLIEERVAQAKEMRRRMKDLADRALELHKELLREQEPRTDTTRAYYKKRDEVWDQWVTSDEAKAPDPRTGKSNQKWRDAEWKRAQESNAELQALKDAREEERRSWSKARLEKDHLGFEMSYLRPSMDLLTAELRSLSR